MKKIIFGLLAVLSLCGFITQPDGTICCSQGVKTTQATTTSTIATREYGNDALHRTVITFTATPMLVTLGTGNIIYGGVGTGSTTAVYTFPKGAISIVGVDVRSSGTPKLTCGITGTVLAGFTSIVSLGTVTTANDATLTGTEANILASSIIAAASTKVAIVKATTSSAPSAPLDGTVTAIPMFLNLVIDTDAGNTSGTCTFTGTVTITWSNLTNN